MIFAHHVRGRELPVNLLKKLCIVRAVAEGKIPVALKNNGFKVFSAHNRACPEPAEMPVGIDIDACHGRSLLARRADAQNAAVPGAGKHGAEHLAAFLHIHAPEVVDIFELSALRAHYQAGGPLGACR